MLLKFRSSRFYLRIKTSDWVVFLTMQAIYFDKIEKQLRTFEARFLRNSPNTSWGRNKLAFSSVRFLKSDKIVPRDLNFMLHNTLYCSITCTIFFSASYSLNQTSYSKNHYLTQRLLFRIYNINQLSLTSIILYTQNL